MALLTGVAAGVAAGLLMTLLRAGLAWPAYGGDFLASKRQIGNGGSRRLAAAGPRNEWPA